MRKYSTQQAGLTIIELMISLVLGLIIVAGVITIFLSNSRAQSYQQSQITLQENMRYMHSLLGSVIRQSGYLPMDSAGSDLITQKALIFPSDVVFTSPGQVVFGTEANAVPSGLPIDQLSIRYTVDDMTINCLGDTIPALNMDLDSQEQNTYRINANGFLECARSNIGAANFTEVQVLVGSNQGSKNQQLTINSLLIFYGQDTDGDNNIDRITRANAVADWTQVRSVELELGLEAGNEISPQSVNYYFDLPNTGG
jgi:type II secretory pathway pseudopilin PulG